MGVNEALRLLIDGECTITADAVKNIVKSGEKGVPIEDGVVEAVDLCAYDELLAGEEVVYG